MISIIIPTYNSGHTIKRCLDSIVEQTFSDWEVLVMDGVSSDETISIARSYNDARISIYSEPDKGIYDAMNKGILKSKGEWLYFLGSDDYLYDAKVLETVEKEMSSYFLLVYGEVEASCLCPKNLGEWRIDLIDYNRCHQALFYHRSLFEKYGLYDTSYKIYADYVFNMFCFWIYNVSAKYIDLTVAHYTEGGTSSTCCDPKFAKDFKYIRSYCTMHKRKDYAKQVIRNTNSIWKKIKMYIYLYYLHIVAYKNVCRIKKS